MVIPIGHPVAKGALILGVLAVGFALGIAMITPARETVVSVVGIVIYFIVIATNPLHGLLLWIVTQPLATHFVNISLGEGVPDLSPTRFCIAFVVILLLARASVGRIRLTRFTKTDAVALLFMFGIVLSAPNGEYGWRSLQTIFDRHIVSVLVYFLAKELVQDEDRLRKVVFASWVLVTYVGLYAIYESLTGKPLFMTVGESQRAIYESGLKILRGLLMNPDSFGRVLGIGIPFNFYLLLEEKRSSRRALYLLTLGIMFSGLYFTYNRTSWIAAIAGLFLIQWFYPRLRNVFLVLLLVTSAALYFNGDRLSDSAVSARVQSGEMSTLHGRTVGWSYAVKVWQRNPIFGHGYGQYRSIARREGARDTAIESQYLHILVSSGLLGFLPYVLLLSMIPLSFVKTFWSRDGPVDKVLIVVYWGAHLSYLINAITTTDGRIVTSALLFLLAGALSGVQAWNLSRRDKPAFVDRAALSQEV
jgi:O-antigen ligase